MLSSLKRRQRNLAAAADAASILEIWNRAYCPGAGAQTAGDDSLADSRMISRASESVSSAAASSQAAAGSPAARAAPVLLSVIDVSQVVRLGDTEETDGGPLRFDTHEELCALETFLTRESDA